MNGNTVLRKKRIAVVSERQKLLDFFRMEAESCGCSVNVFSEMPFDISGYDLIIADTDANKSKSGLYEDERIYTIIPNAKTDVKNKILSYPIPVRELRGLYEGGVVTDSDEQKNSRKVILYIGDGKKRVELNNKKIELTDKEHKLLMRLGQSVGEPVSREELMELLGADRGNIADVYICRLRGKLGASDGARLIRTVRGKGYALVAEIKNINVLKRREK